MVCTIKCNDHDRFVEIPSHYDVYAGNEYLIGGVYLNVHEGYAQHPCTQSVCTLGIAVCPIRSYRGGRPYVRGTPLYM